MKLDDLKKLSPKDLDAKATEFREELFNLKMQKAAMGFEKPHELKKIKKNIARILTIKNSNREAKS